MSAQDKLGIHQLTSIGKECIKHYSSLVRACTKCLHDRTSVACELKLETIDIYSYKRLREERSLICLLFIICIFFLHIFIKYFILHFITILVTLNRLKLQKKNNCLLIYTNLTVVELTIRAS